MRAFDRIVYFLLAALVACLPFEFRSFPLMSNLQWLFVAVSAAALPVMIRDRQKLFGDRLVIAALLFVISQWLAALLAPEFTLNALKAAVRVTAGFTLLSVTLCVPDRRALLKIWSVAAVVAALYAFLDYGGFGAPALFRETEFWIGPVVRLSGSFEYPNTAAAFFALSLPIVWITQKSRWVRIPGFLLVWAALIMTYSRGATVAVLLILLIWALVDRARAAFYFGILSLGAFAALLALYPSVLQRFRERLPPKTLSAEYEPEFNLLRRRPDDLSDMSVRVKNAGTTTWLASKDRPLTLSYWWIDAKEKKFFRAPTIYTPISGPVRPQEFVVIRASFRTPSQPGAYLLTWDISQSGSGWFSGNGVLPGVVEVNVQPGTERWSGHGDVSPWYRRETSRLFVANVPFSRSELWREALDMTLEHPILGVGPDNFRLLYGRRSGLSRWDVNIRSNSLYLELLSGSGLTGIVAFGCVIVAVRRNEIAPVLALGIFLIHGLVDVFLMTTPIYFAFWILLGLSAGSSSRSARAQSL